MATLSLYNQSGANVGSLEAATAVFDVAMNDALLYEAVVAQQANRRIAIADTKSKGEVRGGGKKPWKQKGTGRARHGSSRSPIWKGGGVVFGPTSDRNFSRKMNRKAHKKAMCVALSDAVRQTRFITVDSLRLPEGKTKTVAALLKALPHYDTRTLIVVEPENRDIKRLGQNLPDLRIVPAHALSIEELLRAKRVVISEQAVRVLEQLFCEKKTA